MAARRTVLLTGASGYIAGQILERFRGAYDLRLVDARDTNREGIRVDGVAIADSTDPDRSRYLHLFEGVDTVVHLAYRHPGVTPWGADVPPLERFETEFANIWMAQNIYRCAFDAGVRRVVMASSNHAADWYEHALIHRRRRELVSPDVSPTTSMAGPRRATSSWASCTRAGRSAGSSRSSRCGSARPATYPAGTTRAHSRS